LLGGPPIRPEGPPGWTPGDEDVLESLQAAYRNGSWGKYEGENVKLLEQRLAEYHRVEFASVCASGTYAVELALRALKVGPGDEVILAGYDFPGNYDNIVAVGARPVLVDVSPGNWNLDPDLITDAISPKTRAMIVSHLHGGIVPMGRVMELARHHHLRVLEDAAQMPGARIEGRAAGTWGDVGILSFGGSKLLTSGRGGALLTPHRDVHHRAGVVSWRGNRVCPLSELQAAVLPAQLEKLDDRNQRRSAAVEKLCEGLAGLPLVPLANDVRDSQAGYYKLGLRYKRAGFGGLARDDFVAAMRAEGIALDAGFRGFARRRSGGPRKLGRLPESKRAGQEMLILHHPVLLGGNEMLEQVVRAVEKVQAAARSGEFANHRRGA